MIQAVHRITAINITMMVLLLSACNSGGSTAQVSMTGNSSSSGASTGNTGTPGTTDVLTYHNDAMRTGQNLTETTLTPTNVTSSGFGVLRILAADNPVDATPLIATQVMIGGSAHDVVYVAT